MNRFYTPLLWILFLAPTALGQEVAKTLEWEDHRNPNSGRVDPVWAKRIEAVELEDISIDGTSVLVGEPFVGDMRRLVFRMKNISDAPVSFLQITLSFPRDLKIRHLQIPFVLPKGEDNQPKPLLPGAEAELRLPADQKLSDWIRDSLAEDGQDLRTIRRISIYAVFSSSEGTERMMAGSVKTRDARNECPWK